MMKRVLFALALLVGAVNLPASAQMPMPFTFMQASAGGGGGSGKTVTVVEHCPVGTKSDGTGSQVVVTCAAAPAANRFVDCKLETGDGGGTVSSVTPGDGFGGGTGSWVGYSINPYSLLAGGGGTKLWGFYKAMTAGASGSTITFDISGTQAMDAHCTVLGVTSGTPTWVVNTVVTNRGTGLTGSAGTVSHTNASAWIGNFAVNDGVYFLPSGVFTVQTTSGVWASTEQADQITTSGTSVACDWASNGGNVTDSWAAICVAVEAN